MLFDAPINEEFKKISESFTKLQTQYRGATHKYKVTRTNEAVEWPGDQTLVNWCDGGALNFGGNVEIKTDNVRIVSVYVD